MITETKKRKKLIYIMGCGRSGSTILGFILGNGKNCLDLGEVIDFLKREGNPNSFDDESENGTFWNLVKRELLKEQKNIFNKINIKHLTKIERHESFPLVYCKLASRKIINRYYNYSNSLYRNIIKYAQSYEYFIDSSKYPGKALLLSFLLNEMELYVLHLVRNPIGVVNSLTNIPNNTSTKSKKGFWKANLYYFIINLLSYLVKLKVDKDYYIKVKYEDILTKTEQSLIRISRHTGIELQQVTNKIHKKEPLKRGYIFNGNRMRMKEKVYLETDSPFYPKTIRNILTTMINGFWY